MSDKVLAAVRASRSALSEIPSTRASTTSTIGGNEKLAAAGSSIPFRIATILGCRTEGWEKTAPMWLRI